MNTYLNGGRIYKNLKNNEEEILMNIIAIEQTPNPNSMRVVLDTELPSGTSHNYTKKDAATASEPAASILNIEGIRGIYHVMNFMAVEKNSDVEWDGLLESIQTIIPKK